jgi:hypothetical protein
MHRRVEGGDFESSMDRYFDLVEEGWAHAARAMIRGGDWSAAMEGSCALMAVRHRVHDIYACVCACVFLFVCVVVHVFGIFVPTHTRARRHTHARTHTDAHATMHAYMPPYYNLYLHSKWLKMHLFVCIYVYIHTYIHL